jgi:hypothetical protein
LEKSKDVILGDLVAERWDHHDQTITFGNVEYEMHEQLQHALLRNVQTRSGVVVRLLAGRIQQTADLLTTHG